MNAPTPKAPFVMPTTLGQFNELIQPHGFAPMSLPLFQATRDHLGQDASSSPEGSVEERGRAKLVSIVRNLHAGGRNGDNAKAYLQRVLAEVQRGMRASEAEQQGSREPHARTPATQQGAQPAPAPTAPAATAARAAPAAPYGAAGLGPRNQPHPTATRAAAPPQQSGTVAEFRGRRQEAAPERTPVPSAAPAAACQAPRVRQQARAYGGKAALCVEQSENAAGAPTLRFEFGRANGEHSYDWSRDKKLVFDLTPHEIPQLIACMLGFVKTVEFSKHGPNKTKWMRFAHQDRGYYICAGDKDVAMMALPVSTFDTMMAMYGLALGQLTKIAYLRDASALIAFVRAAVAPRIVEPQPREQRRAAG